MVFRGSDLLKRAARLERRGHGLRQPGHVSRKVLLVEGCPGKLGDLQKALAPLGFDAVSVGNERNALELIGKDRPAVVFSSIDLEEKGLEGYELCYWEGEKPPVPLVYIRASEEKGSLLGEKLGEALSFLARGQKDEPSAPETGPTDSIQEGSDTPARSEDFESATLQPESDELSGFRCRESDTSSEEHLVFSEYASADDIMQGFRDLGGENIGLGARFEDLLGRDAPRRPGVAPTVPEAAAGKTQQDKTTLEEFREEFRTLSATKGEVKTEAGPIDSVDRIFEQFLKVEEAVRSGEEDSRDGAESRAPGGEAPDEQFVAERGTEGSLYQRATDFVLRSIRSLNEGGSPDLKQGERLIQELDQSLAESQTLLMQATARDQDYSLSGHSVNVTILSLKIVQTLGWSSSGVRRVGLAALVHEIGVFKLPPGLAHSQAALDKTELNLLRRRPVFTAQILGEKLSGYGWLAEIVGQVYEREDGSGFPLGLKGKAISEEAKVIGLADFFEACIHRRPYRAPLTGYQTLFELTTEYSDAFADRIVKALIKSLSLYPYNEFVVLDSGEIGRVIGINPEKLSRPVIEILFDSEDTLTVQSRTVDLAAEPERYIAKSIPVQELPF